MTLVSVHTGTEGLPASIEVAMVAPWLLIDLATRRGPTGETNTRFKTTQQMNPFLKLHNNQENDVRRWQRHRLIFLNYKCLQNFKEIRPLLNIHVVN